MNHTVCCKIFVCCGFTVWIQSRRSCAACKQLFKCRLVPHLNSHLHTIDLTTFSKFTNFKVKLQLQTVRKQMACFISSVAYCHVVVTLKHARRQSSCFLDDRKVKQITLQDDMNSRWLTEKAVKMRQLLYTCHSAFSHYFCNSRRHSNVCVRHEKLQERSTWFPK